MKDFFISYNRHDADWAEWIAWILEENGYTVTIQAWDFRPGGNFAVDMNEATKNSRRTIAVLSETYLRSDFTLPQWTAAFINDPTSKNYKLLPIKVKPCKPEGLLQGIVYADLVEKSEEEAEKALLLAVRENRGKPGVKPSFPGKTPLRERLIQSKKAFPTAEIASPGQSTEPEGPSEVLPIPNDDHFGVEDPLRSGKDVQQKSPGWIELILQRHPPYNIFHWPRIILAFCVIAAGLSGLGLFVRLRSPTTDDEHEPPEFVDSSQIDSRSEILDVRVSSDTEYFAFLTAAGFLEIRELYIENHAFQNPPEEDYKFIEDSERQLEKIDFRSKPEDADSDESEVFVANTTNSANNSGKVRKITFTNGSALSPCSLRNSQPGQYYLETSANSKFPFLAITSGSMSEIYVLKISSKMDIITDEKGFCQQLETRPNSTLISQNPELYNDNIPSEAAIDLKFNPAFNGLVFATAHKNNEIYLWQICTDNAPKPCAEGASDEYVMLLAAPWSSGEEEDSISSISFNSDGTYLAVGYESEKIKILEIKNASIEEIGETPSVANSYVDNMIVSFSLNESEPNILFSAANRNIKKWNVEELRGKLDESRSLPLKSEAYQGKLTHLYGLSSSTVLFVMKQQDNLYSLRIEPFE